MIHLPVIKYFVTGTLENSGLSVVSKSTKKTFTTEVLSIMCLHYKKTSHQDGFANLIIQQTAKKNFKSILLKTATN